MRALVTGAGGFVGANLVRHLLEQGHEPVAAIRPGAGSWRLEAMASDVPTSPVDLRDPAAVQHTVADVRPEVIFHLAAHGAYSWQTDLDAMLATNIRCTDALLTAAARIDASLVSAGSSSEYGYKDHPPTEEERVEPNSLYAISKVASTHLCRLAAATTGIRAVTLRLYSIYGNWEEPGRLMPTLVTRCLDGELPPLVNPETARDFVWVEDACEAFVLAATVDLADSGTVLNVASGTQTRLESVVAAARQVFSVSAQPSWGAMPARRWDTSTWVGDPTKAGRILGWKARTSLEDGLARLGSWFSEHPDLRARYGTS